MEWAEAQSSEEVVPAITGSGISHTLHHVVRVRSKVHHFKGKGGGESKWNVFWSDMYRSAVETCRDSLIPLLSVIHQHMGSPGSIPAVPSPARGKGKRQGG